MKAKYYSIIQRAVEDGALYGYRRAHKHTEEPPEYSIIEHITMAIMGELCESFTFEIESDL